MRQNYRFSTHGRCLAMLRSGRSQGGTTIDRTGREAERIALCALRGRGRMGCNMPGALHRCAGQHRGRCGTWAEDRLSCRTGLFVAARRNSISWNYAGTPAVYDMWESGRADVVRNMIYDKTVRSWRYIVVAFPDFPTYQQYADWLKTKAFRSIGKNEWGNFMFAARPDGLLHVFEPALDPDAPLVPSTVERIDHRLGVVSPWNPLSETQLKAADD